MNVSILQSYADEKPSVSTRNRLDAAAILKAVVNNTAIDVAVGDYNADGAVNALDAAAILKFVVSKA